MQSSVSRRVLLSGAGGLAAATVLRRPANAAAEFSYKYASVLPVDHPMMIRSREAVATIKEKSGAGSTSRFIPTACSAPTRRCSRSASRAPSRCTRFRVTCSRHAYPSRA